MAETYVLPALTTPTQDERVMAALSHLAIIIPYVGLVVPVLIWINQREKSRYVTFQALQAIAYQVVWLFAWGFFMVCYIGSFIIGFIGAGALAESTRGPGGGDLAMLFPFLLLGVFSLGALVYLVYGLAAAVLTFQGKPFRYLLISGFVERYMQQPKPEIA